MDVAFYIAASVAIGSTVMVVTALRAVHALLYLIVSLLSVAVIFFMLGAPFIAALEAIVYAGAIMVLFVFAIMLLNLGSAEAAQERQWLNPRMWAGPSILCVVLLGELIYILSRGESHGSSATVVGPKQVSVVLLGPYLIGVELASMLLLAGLIGAYHLGRPSQRERG
ncbi:MAG: NADH-quinone oxidoreductase subunit J [Candidatus Methylomirabilota bacterium]|nr:NADH-quinone oxidoreductase subunit J [Candidatus Methylomirabilis sp.]NJD68174.1 NADH-quinone oxidoreductase subunit J [candidate division NC10 bacterium]PWB46342.1 MAG: NADH-quinone oxidoreductase subunit J [candidate division NC10 bacterium]